MEESQQTSTPISKVKALLNKFPILSRSVAVLLALLFAIFALEKWDEHRENMPSGTHAQTQEILPDPETKKILMHVPVSYIKLGNGAVLLHPENLFSCLDGYLQINFGPDLEISGNADCETGFLDYSYYKGEEGPILTIIGTGSEIPDPPTDANLEYQGE